MSQPATKSLTRLAWLARDIERKRMAHIRLADAAKTLQATGTVVDGELWLQGQLDARLTAALTQLDRLLEISNVQAAVAELDELEATLDSPEWDAAAQILDDLQARWAAQEQQLKQADDQIAEWQTGFRDLLAQIEEARRARAPIRRAENELLRLQGLKEQADRALRERNLPVLTDLVEQLHNQQTGTSALAAQIKEKTDASRPIARQADLLLLQSPLLENRYEYTVLMRTPSEPGTHSINIRDSSTISCQDRQLMSAAIDQVTQAVNTGLARKFSLRSENAVAPANGPAPAAPLAPTEAPAPTVPPPAPEPPPIPVPDNDTVRQWFAVEPGGPRGPVDVTGLAEEVGDLMYRLFMPEQMQQYLTGTPCSLTITTNDLELPWELMWYQGNFLCLDRPVARLPMGRAFPRVQVQRARMGRKLRFLLIHADPVGNLPAAKAEIERIEEALKEEWKDQIEIDVLLQDKAKGQEVNRILRKGLYDVIHYAGHAAFDPDDPDLSGLLLHDSEVFFAQKIRRLLEGRPLVFLNACESGRTANEQDLQTVGQYLQKPAEGLASAFIYGGALGCIGALWPVYDQPAAEFAVNFYRQVLEGAMIGEAMRQARLAIKHQYPDQITWAAFALYGDPTFRLVD